MALLKFEDLIILENENYLIVNKPPFISSLEDRNDHINLHALAKTYHPDAQLCHRLDKETSGILAIAKHPEAYKSLAVQFENRAVIKEYHTVVDGIHQFQDTMLEFPIQISSKGTVRIDHQRGKPSSTKIQKIKTFKKHTQLACFPFSGRMHQIRIHLSHIKSPIVGDLTYGGTEFYLSSIKKNYHLKKDTEEMPLIKRIALHAYQLSFSDISGETISATAPYPKDFAVLLKQLNKHQ